MLNRTLLIVASVMALSAPLASARRLPSNARADGNIVGRWDMTIQDASGTWYHSWFELTREGEKLAGRFVGRSGSQGPIKSIEFANGHLIFSLPIQFEANKNDLKFEANLNRERLEGTTFDRQGRT